MTQDISPQLLPPFLPEPRILKGYHEIDASIPDAYLQLVWEETQHRRQLECIALDAAARRASRSGWLIDAAMILTVLLAGAVLLLRPMTWPLLVGLMGLLSVTWGVPMMISRQGVQFGGGEDEQTFSRAQKNTSQKTVPSPA